MLTRLYIFLLACLPAFFYSQNVVECFKLLPQSFLGDLTPKMREVLLKEKQYYPADNVPGQSMAVYRLVAADTLKGFLRVELSFETGQAGFAVYELRLFSKKGGGSILVFSRFGGAHRMIEQDKLEVFSVKAKKLSSSSRLSLPENPSVSLFLKPGTPADTLKMIRQNTSAFYELGYGYVLGYENENLKCTLVEMAPGGQENKSIAGHTVEYEWTGEKFRQKPLKRED